LSKPWPTAKDCAQCGAKAGSEGRVYRQGVHMRLDCGCGAYQKFMALEEVGERTTSLTGRDGIKPKIKEAVRERDNNRCLLCGNSGFDGHQLHVAHILSFAEGLALGATAEELDDECNLFMCCDAHNAGQGKRSFSPKMALLILRCIRADRARRAC